MSIPREAKVGAFVFVGFILIGIVIFLIGEERSMFTPKSEFFAVFEDVEGLKRGSPVRMGGVDVGSVKQVEYGDDPTDASLYVRIDVVANAAQRVRKDSRVTIAPKGLLGDKMLEITVGSQKEPPIPEGGTIPGGKRDDMFSQLGKLSEKASGIMDNLEKTTDALADDQFRDDLKSSAHSLSNILRALDEGEGYAARLLNDPDEAEKLSRTLSTLQNTSNELNRTVHNVGNIVSRVESGPGFAHDVIYGDAPTETIEKFGEAAGEVALTLRGIREGDGMARTMLYGGGESEDLVQNLNAVSGDLRAIVSDVRAGKGTLGALLVDPSVYEDLKMMLGNVSRNKALKALVRYSIRRDEKVPSVQVADPAAVAEPRRPEGGADVRFGARIGSEAGSTGNQQPGSGGGTPQAGEPD